MGAIYLGFEIARWGFATLGVLVCIGAVALFVWGWPKLMALGGCLFALLGLVAGIAVGWGLSWAL